MAPRDGWVLDPVKRRTLAFAPREWAIQAEAKHMAEKLDCFSGRTSGILKTIVRGSNCQFLAHTSQRRPDDFFHRPLLD